MTGETWKCRNCRENSREGIESCCHRILAFCSFIVTDQGWKKIRKKMFVFEDFVASINHIH